MKISIKNVRFSKNPVGANEIFKVLITIKEEVSEPKMYRLPFRLAKKKKGGIR